MNAYTEYCRSIGICPLTFEEESGLTQRQKDARDCKLQTARQLDFCRKYLDQIEVRMRVAPETPDDDQMNKMTTMLLELTEALHKIERSAFAGII